MFRLWRSKRRRGITKEDLIARLKAIQETIGSPEPGNIFPFNDGVDVLLEYIEEKEVWEAFEVIQQRAVSMECEHEFTDRLLHQTELRAEKAEIEVFELQTKLAAIPATEPLNAKRN